MSSAERYVGASESALSVAHDVLLLDLDGTTYLGAVPAPYAPQALIHAKENGAHLAYVTNNSGRTPEVVAEHLGEIGIPTEPSDVLNSSQAAAIQAREILPPDARVLLVGGEGLRRAFEATSLQIVSSADEKPDAVIQGLSEETNWAQLSEAVLAITLHGAQHIATNLDATVPKERGAMIGNGSLVAAVVNATGVTPINCGKPEPFMFGVATSITKASTPLAIGDRLNTDIAGAVKADIPCLHVLTGVSQAHDVMLAHPSERPTFLGLDLRDVNEPHPAVTRIDIPSVDRDGGSSSSLWRCGDWNACVDNGCLVVEDASAEIDNAGLAAAAVHSQMQPSAGQQPAVSIQLGTRDSAELAHTPSLHVSLQINAYRAATSALWEAADMGIIDRTKVQLPQIHVHRENVGCENTEQ